MRVLVLCAGEATRWGDFLGVPKHLAPVDGEPVVHRIARLLTPYTDDVRIILQGYDRRYETHGALIEPVRVNPDNREADKFLSSMHLWDPDDRTVILYGDAFLTEEAVDTIMTSKVTGWHMFGRFGPNPHTARPYGEIFGFTLDPKAHSTFRTGLNRLRTHDGRLGGWELYRTLRTGNPGAEHADYGNATEIIDWSDDLDFPSDWVEMVARRAAAR